MNIRYGGRPAYQPLASPIYRFLGGIQQLVSCLSITVEWCRYGIGFRYLHPIRVMLVLLLMLGVHFLWSQGITIRCHWEFLPYGFPDWIRGLLPNIHWVLLPTHGNSRWFLGFMALFGVSCGIHWLIALVKTVRGLPLHSHDRGKAWWHLLQVPDYIGFAWIDPMLTATFSLYCVPDPLLRVWLIVAAVALWLRHQVEAVLLLWLRMDRGDSAIEGGSLNLSELSGKTHNNPRIARMKPKKTTLCPTRETAYEKLTPSLRALMERDTQKGD